MNPADEYIGVYYKVLILSLREGTVEEVQSIEYQVPSTKYQVSSNE